MFANFPVCRTRSEDSADRVGGRAAQDVLRKEFEGEVTQEETECFDRSDRVLPGEPKIEELGKISQPFLRKQDCIKRCMEQVYLYKINLW